MGNHIKGERTWVSQIQNSETKYIITSKQSGREWYYLYEWDGSKYKKISKSRNPNELDKIIKEGVE